MPDRQSEGRVSLEERLRASEARWRAVVESAVDGIIVIDARGRVEAFNPAAERLFGYTESEVTGQNVNMLMPSPYHDEHDGYLARYLETGVHKIIGIGREVTGRRKDGSTFPLHLSVGETSVGGERKFTGILHDLTERVAMEEQLREQAALARLGEMAAVLAHEVKNPLAAVRGAIEVIGSRLPSGTRDAAVVKEIVSRIDSLNIAGHVDSGSAQGRPGAERGADRCGRICTARIRRSRSASHRVPEPDGQQRARDARPGPH
jgi:PAS domain S-box-containing protein